MWNESSSSKTSLNSFNAILDIAVSNSSGKASPEERPRSPKASLEPASSLDSLTAFSKVNIPDWMSFNTLSIDCLASAELS